MTGVNMVFFMGGPQLGELEAGAVANWLGAPFSVVSGGIGCLIAVVVGRRLTPMLRHYGRTEGPPAPGLAPPPLPPPAIEGHETEATSPPR